MSQKRFYMQCIAAGALGLSTAYVSDKLVTYYGKKERIRKAFEGNKKKIAVVGAGYAGRAFLKEINTDMYDVVVIDKNLRIETDVWFEEKVNKIVFEPQPNYVDSISDNKMITNFMVLDKLISDVQGEVVDVDKDKQLIKLKDDSIIPYDYLVMATGSVPDTFNVKMNYDCNNNMWYYFKDGGDVKALMTAIKLVGLKDVVVMGGGITGVELASELSKKIEEYHKQNGTVGTNKFNVTILEPNSRLLPKLRDSISQQVTEHLERHKVNIITNANIQEIHNGTIKLIHNEKDELSIKAVIAVWTCGVKPDGLVTSLLGTNEVDRHLRLTLKNTNNQPIDSVYCIGDTNQLLPKSAQHAKQQGIYLARYFNSQGFNEFDAPRFKFESQGQMIRLSDSVFMDSPAYTGMLPLIVHRIIIGLDI